MVRRFFAGCVAVAVLFGVPGLAQASLKAKIQKRLDRNEGKTQNVQYQPYYRENNYRDGWGEPARTALTEAEVDEVKPQEEVANKEARFRQVGAVQKSFCGNDALQTRGDVQQGTNFIVYNVSYVGTLEENVVTVEGEIVFEVFDHPYLKRAEIPLMNNQVGLIDVQVNRGKSFVMSRGGKYYLVIDRPGRYTLDMEYLLKVQRERENGPGSFYADIMPAPISQFEFIVPEENVQVFVEPSIKVETEYKDQKTSAWAVMPNTNRINVRWTKALPKTTIEKVELEPKLYAETSTFVAIGGGVVQAHAQIHYSILQSEVSTFRLALPKNVSVLSVNSHEMRDWKVSKEKDVQYLDVFLNFGTKGKHVVNVSFERNMDEGLSAVGMPWIRAVGVERENGFYGIAASTNLEIKVGRSERVTRIDSKQLPQFIWSQASRPILLAFKYLNHPFAIDVEMTRHEEIPILVAAIDSAYPETLVTKDGKALTKLTFNVRNNVKQYLRIKLPDSATVWSSFVNGEPVKPAKDKKGNVLISLKKSNRGGSNVTQFPVEIVYLDKAPEIKGVGDIKLVLPKVDLPVNQMNWRIYMPDDFIYFGAKSDGDIFPPRQFRGRQRGLLGGMAARQSRMVASDDIGDQYASSMPQQAMLEKDAAQFLGEAKTKGLLPIKVDLPRRGDAYQVSKMLVVEGDQPWISLRYVAWGRSASRWVKFIKIALFLIAIILVIRFVIKKFPGRKKKVKEVQE